MPNSQIVVANWKMNGTVEAAVKLAKNVVKGSAGVPATVVLCPPCVHIPYISDITKGNAVVMGGQDCHWEERGAFTGDVSAQMLKDLACEYVIVGHSERRQHHGEDNQLVRKKAESAIKVNLQPIICVGETAEERKKGKAYDVVEKQVKESVPGQSAQDQLVVAYEPVWSIGTGQVPTKNNIQEMHEHIINVLKNNFSGTYSSHKVLYGGSVKGDNALSILALEGVGGVLVGGASLNAQEFLTIVKAAK